MLIGIRKKEYFLLNIVTCHSITLVLLMLCFNSFSQNKEKVKIDSISKLLNTTTNYTGKINLYYQLSELNVNVDSSKAIDYAIKGIALAKTKKDSFLIAKGRFTYAGVYFDYNRRAKAKLYYEAADAILSKLIKNDSSDKVLKLWVRSNFNIGVVVSYEGNFEQIKYLDKITPVAEKFNFMIFYQQLIRI